jgi:hypothetical protein
VATPQCGALFLVLAPGQPYDDGVEDGQRDQSQGGAQGDAVELVADEGDQEGDRPWAGPEFVAQQREDQDNFDDAMQQQVRGGESDGRAGQAVGDLRRWVAMTSWGSSESSCRVSALTMRLIVAGDTARSGHRR